MVEPEPAPFAPDMRRQQPGAFRERYQFEAEFVGRAVRALPLVTLQRHDFVAHKPLGAFLEGENYVGNGEIHRLPHADAWRIVELPPRTGKRGGEPNSE